MAWGWGLMGTEEELLMQAEEEKRQRAAAEAQIWPQNNPVGTETTHTLTPRTWWDDTRDALWRGVSDPSELLKMAAGSTPAGNAVLAGKDIAEGGNALVRAALAGNVEGTRDPALQIGLAGASVLPIFGGMIRKEAPAIRAAAKEARAAARAADLPAPSAVARAVPEAPVPHPAAVVEPPPPVGLMGPPEPPAGAVAPRGPVEGVPVPEPPPEVVVPPAAAKKAPRPPPEMYGPSWRPLGEPPKPTPGAPTDLPPLGEGLLYDPVKAAQAREGATLGMTPEQYDAYIQKRGEQLDPGVATLVKPRAEKGREGTMAGTPNLRTMTVDDALVASRAEPHLIQKEGGGYVGAPHHIKSREQLEAQRAKFDASVAGGEGGADWYLRVKKYADELSGRDPVAGRQLAEELALFSAQSDPFTNLGFAQQARQAWVRGEPSPRTRTGQQAERFNAARAAQEEAIRTGQPFPNMPEGKKTGIFRQHMDISALMGTTGTNDIWHARAFGFRDPKTGKPWDKALTETNHSWLDYETMLAVDRANAKKLGGRSDWTPAEIQAAPWVAEKAKSLEKRFKIPSEEAFSRATSTYPDYAPHYTMEAPAEMKPGGKTGLGYGSMTPEEWQAASRRVDPGGLDPTFRNMGMNQRAVATGATGAWKERGKPAEYNPVDVSRPMIDFQGSGAQRQVHPGTVAGLDAAVTMRGLNDFQVGSPVTMWDTRAGSNARSSIRIDLGRGVTEEEAARLHKLGKKYKYDFANTGTGAGFLNFTGQKGSQVQRVLDKKLAAEINKIVPGAVLQRAAPSGPYANFEDKLNLANQGKGKATRMLDQKLQAAEQAGAPGMVKSLLDDPNEAVHTQQNLQRLMASGQLGVRQDYEKWLRLVSELRLRGAMEYARSVGYKGLPAVAGGAVLGGGLLGGQGSTEPGA